MKNVLVANKQAGSRIDMHGLTALLEAQIENSLAVGWSPSDIIVITNFAYSFMDVTAIEMPLNGFCLTGSKIFAVHAIFEAGLVGADEVCWAHDLDAWQNFWFDCPPFADIGAAEYSRPHFNGGSVFYSARSRDIVIRIVDELTSGREKKEEPTLNRVLKSAEFRDRVTVINSTFNVGCSGYVKRCARSHKPILVSHFHPTNRIAWDTHVDDRNGIGESSVCPRLLDLLIRYFHGGVRPAKLIRRNKRAHDTGDSQRQSNAVHKKPAANAEDY